MTRPEAMANEKQKSAHPEDVEEVDEEQEEEDWDTAYIPGMCAKKDYERQCQGCATQLLCKRRGMSEADAKAFVQDTVNWAVKGVFWEDYEQARSVKLTVRFNLGKAPFIASLDYACILRWTGADLHCRLKWDAPAPGGAMPLILRDGEFMLTAPQLKAARERCFPDGWRTVDVMEFVYACIGNGGHKQPCHSAESEAGVSNDTSKLCKALGEAAAQL